MIACWKLQDCLYKQRLFQSLKSPALACVQGVAQRTNYFGGKITHHWSWSFVHSRDNWIVHFRYKGLVLLFLNKIFAAVFKHFAFNVQLYTVVPPILHMKISLFIMISITQQTENDLDNLKNNLNFYYKTYVTNWRLRVWKVWTFKRQRLSSCIMENAKSSAFGANFKLEIKIQDILFSG